MTPPARDAKVCTVCGEAEPFHIHDGDRRIDDYFTVGRGQTDFEAAQAWGARAVKAEAALAAARQVDEATTDRLWCAIDDQLPIGEAPPSMDILRAALLAALTPEPEEKR